MARRILPEESTEKIRHEFHGQKAVMCLTGHFSFAFTSLFVEDVGESLVTGKQAQNLLKLTLAA